MTTAADEPAVRAPDRDRPTVRRFRRDDRDQLAELVNTHVQAVVPGGGVTVSRLLAHLEREPGEQVVDPWVRERLTLVALQRDRVSAAAHLLTYRDEESVGAAYRGLGEIRWVVAWPDSPPWPHALDAGRALVDAAVSALRRAGCSRIAADGALPAPGVFGIPAQWPHVADLLTGAGFAAGGRAERVFLADLLAPRDPVPSPAGAHLARSVGGLGTVLTAVRGGERLGYIEVCHLAGDIQRVGGDHGWADVANLWVEPAARRGGVGSWLLAEACRWLRLGGADRLLDYCDATDTAYAGFLRARGLLPLTTTRRDWLLAP